MVSMKARGPEAPLEVPDAASSEHAPSRTPSPCGRSSAPGRRRRSPRRGPRSCSNLASQDWLLVGYFVVILVGARPSARAPIATPASSAWRPTSGVYLFVLALVRCNVLRWGGAASSLLYRVAIIATLLGTFFQLREILPAGEPLGARRAASTPSTCSVFGFEPSVWLDRCVTPATTEWFAFFYFLYFLILACTSCRCSSGSATRSVLDALRHRLAADVPAAHLIYMIVPGCGPVLVPARRRSTHELTAARSGAACARRSTPAAPRRTSFPVPAHGRRRRSSPSSASATASSSRSSTTWPVMAFLATQIIIATMFLRWHYLVDIFAGLTLAGDRGSSSASTSRTGKRARRERMGMQPAWMPLVYPWSRPSETDVEARATAARTDAWIRDHRHGPLRAGPTRHQRRPVARDGHERRVDLQALRHPAASLRARGRRRAATWRVEASQRAIEAAGIRPDEIDYVVFATMTPGLHLPGPGRAARAQARARGRPRARHPPAVRGDALRAADRRRPDQERRRADHPLRRRRGARRLHALGRLGRARPRERARRPRRRQARARTSTARSPSSSATAPARSSSARPIATPGCAAMKLHTDGGAAKLLYVEGGGFRTRPYWKHSDFDEQKYIPTMDGRELFKFAVTKLPEMRARALRRDEHVDRADRLVSRPPGQRPHQRVRPRAAGRAAREAAVEHRPLRQHERRHAPHPHRRADARGQAEARASCACSSRSARASTGAARSSAGEAPRWTSTASARSVCYVIANMKPRTRILPRAVAFFLALARALDQPARRRRTRAASVSIAATWDGLLHESTTAAVVTRRPSRARSGKTGASTRTRTCASIAPVAGELAAGARPGSAPWAASSARSGRSSRARRRSRRGRRRCSSSARARWARTS